jgi:hypothetical protein
MAGAGRTAGNKKIEGLRRWMLDGKLITPVLYCGRAVGHGKYFACEVDGVLQVDENGIPYHFRTIGELV